MKKFRFNNGEQVGDLDFDFNRNTATVDPLGNAVSANSPRFGLEKAISPVTPQVETIFTVTSCVILGSGFDHDNVTPLTVVKNTTGSQVITYVGEDIKAIHDEEPGAGTKNITSLGTNGDIFGNVTAENYYQPNAGLVCHGLIILLCSVINSSSQTYAVALVISQDEGQTWSLHWTGETIQTGVNRVREWAMSNHYPIPRVDPPLKTYIPFVDYRNSGDGANGGSAYLVRATRETATGEWTLEDVETVYNREGGTVTHFHVSSCTPFGANGLRYIVAQGDTLENNVVVSITRDDEDYTVSEGWTAKVDYHGVEGTKTVGGTAQYGNQYISVAWHRDNNKLIVGADEVAEALNLLTMDDSADSRADFRYLYGYVYSDSTQSLVISPIRTPKPQLGQEFVVVKRASGNYAEGAKARRIIYSSDGDNWVEAYGEFTECATSACIVGNYIYMDGIGLSTGFRRIKKPTTIYSGRPLLTSRGMATNYRTSGLDTISVQTGASVTLLTNISGNQWQDGEKILNAPCLGPVYKVVQARADNATGLLARFRWRGNASEFPLGPYSARVWVYPIEGTDEVQRIHARPAISTNNGSLMTFDIVGKERWFPIDLRQSIGTPGSNGIANFDLRHHNDTSFGNKSYYVALDYLSELDKFDSYPLATNSTENPHELAKLAGFNCGNSWTINVWGQIPETGFDKQATTEGSTYPLFTIWNDADNHYVFIADIANDRISCVLTRAGSITETILFTNVHFRRLGVFGFVASGRLDLSSNFEITLTAHGKPVQSANIGAVGNKPLGNPVEIRFSNAAQTEVGAFSWMGGFVDESTYNDATNRGIILQDLSFVEEEEGGGATFVSRIRNRIINRIRNRIRNR